MDREVAAYLRHRDEIAGMLDERFYPLWWVDQRVSEGTLDLFANERAIIGVEAKTYPGGATEYHGLFAAGDLDAIEELVGEAVALAQHAGMTVAAIESRPGWLKVLRRQGFELDRVRIVKELG